jgi:hypothetical protein
VTSNFLEIIEASVGYILFLLILVDVVLSSTWNRMYFTSGLPLFIRRIPVDLRHTNIPPWSRFDAQFQSALVFKEIELNTYGFRENFFKFRLNMYTPIMHGMLFFDIAHNQVVVKGFVNWFILWFSLIWFGGLTVGGIMNFPESALTALAFIALLALLLGTIYKNQYDWFTKVAIFAAQEWARKDVVNVGGA